MVSLGPLVWDRLSAPMTSRGNPNVKAAVVVLFKKSLRVIGFMAGDYRDGNDCASTGVGAVPFLGLLALLPVELHVCSDAESKETQLLSVSGRVKSNPLLPSVALITGGPKGTGAATAVALAERGGADIVIVGRRLDDEVKETQRRVEALGRKCLLVLADLAVAREACG